MFGITERTIFCYYVDVPAHCNHYGADRPLVACCTNGFSISNYAPCTQQQQQQQNLTIIFSLAVLLPHEFVVGFTGAHWHRRR